MLSNKDCLSTWIQNKKFISQINDGVLNELQDHIIHNVFGGFTNLLKSLLRDYNDTCLTHYQQLKLNNILSNIEPNKVTPTKNDNLSLFMLSDDCFLNIMGFMDYKSKVILQYCCRTLLTISRKPCAWNIKHLTLIGSYKNTIASLILSNDLQDNIHVMMMMGEKNNPVSRIFYERNPVNDKYIANCIPLKKVFSCHINVQSKLATIINSNISNKTYQQYAINTALDLMYYNEFIYKILPSLSYILNSTYEDHKMDIFNLVRNTPRLDEEFIMNIMHEKNFFFLEALINSLCINGDGQIIDTILSSATTFGFSVYIKSILNIRKILNCRHIFRILNAMSWVTYTEFETLYNHIISDLSFTKYLCETISKDRIRIGNELQVINENNVWIDAVIIDIDINRDYRSIPIKIHCRACDPKYDYWLTTYRTTWSKKVDSKFVIKFNYDQSMETMIDILKIANDNQKKRIINYIINDDGLLMRFLSDKIRDYDCKDSKQLKPIQLFELILFCANNNQKKRIINDIIDDDDGLLMRFLSNKIQDDDFAHSKPMQLFELILLSGNDNQKKRMVNYIIDDGWLMRFLSNNIHMNSKYIPLLELIFYSADDKQKIRIIKRGYFTDIELYWNDQRFATVFKNDYVKNYVQRLKILNRYFRLFYNKTTHDPNKMYSDTIDVFRQCVHNNEYDFDDILIDINDGNQSVILLYMKKQMNWNTIMCNRFYCILKLILIIKIFDFNKKNIKKCVFDMINVYYDVINVDNIKSQFPIIAKYMKNFDMDGISFYNHRFDYSKSNWYYNNLKRYKKRDMLVKNKIRNGYSNRKRKNDKKSNKKSMQKVINNYCKPNYYNTFLE